MGKIADADYRVSFLGRIGGEEVVLHKVVSSRGALETLQRRLDRRGERILAVQRRAVGPWEPFETGAGR